MEETTVTGMVAVRTALITAFNSAATEITGTIGDILPIALPVVGAVIVIGVGIKVFKKVVNK